MELKITYKLSFPGERQRIDYYPTTDPSLSSKKKLFSDLSATTCADDLATRAAVYKLPYTIRLYLEVRFKSRKNNDSTNRHNACFPLKGTRLSE